MTSARKIGIVGGVGPYAGLDLAKKIFDQTIACKDAEHLPVILISEPSEIPERTEFLLGRQPVNPAYALLERLRRLEEAGAEVAGIPCNTSHSTKIMGVLREEAAKLGLKIKLLDMAQELALHCESLGEAGRRPGVLATLGTCKAGVYQDAFKARAVACLLPSEETMRSVHEAIYDPGFGIKAASNPPTKRARETILAAIEELAKHGASAVALCCTELPLAVPESFASGLPLVDSTLILARALVRESAPERLRPFRR